MLFSPLDKYILISIIWRDWDPNKVPQLSRYRKMDLWRRRDWTKWPLLPQMVEVDPWRAGIPVKWIVLPSKSLRQRLRRRRKGLESQKKS